MTCPTVIRVTTGTGPPGIGLPAGTGDAGKFVRKVGATAYAYELVTPDQVGLPQGLSSTSSPTFAGLTLSGQASPVVRLVVVGANGQLISLAIGTNLAIVDGALVAAGSSGGSGGYPSLTMPTGFSVAGNTSASLVVTFATGYSLPTNTRQELWDTAYSERLYWDGSSTGLNATTARISLGLGSAALASAGDFATPAQGALAATAVQPPGLASTLAAYLTTASAASSYQPLSANLTALAANGTAYYLARGNHSGTQPLSTISGLGTGIAPALAANAGAAGAPVLFDGAGGTPSSLGLVNATGLPLATGVSGLLSIANGGTGTATPGLVAGTHVTITGTWPNQTISATGGGGGGGIGTVTSVGLVAPTGFSVTGSPVTTSGNITLSFAAGYSLPLDTSQANWNTAFSERLRWDGGSTGLDATTGRTSLGLGSLATQSGTFSGTSSGTNTGDNAINTLYSGLVSNANHTGDATGSTVLTLATVNLNVGSFGSATAAPIFTVNAKGLITAASAATITPAVSSITGLGTGVATALAASVGSAGAPVVFGGAGGTPSAISLTNGSGLPLATGVTGLLPVANGGTGTASPGLVQGTNITISGSWPNQTISSTGGGSFDPASPGAIGGTAPAAGSFTALSASASLLLPSAASGTPAAGHLYRIADQLRYRDSAAAEQVVLHGGGNLANLADRATARTNLDLTAIATATPTGGLSIQSGNLVMTEGIVLTISNTGEAATLRNNYEEKAVDRACAVVGVTFELNPTTPSTSGSSQVMLFARRSGTKTSLLTTNASLPVTTGIFTNVTANLTGSLTLAAGESVGADLIAVGTGATGLKLTVYVRYS
jgi:hypothetical protein